MPSHVMPVKTYVLIFVTLLCLTALTIELAFVNLGHLNIYAAMTIAIVKALLVVLFFMHLRYSSSLTKLFVAAGILWFGILISLTASDYFTRRWMNPAEGWVGIEQVTPDPRGLNAH